MDVQLTVATKSVTKSGPQPPTRTDPVTVSDDFHVTARCSSGSGDAGPSSTSIVDATTGQPVGSGGMVDLIEPRTYEFKVHLDCSQDAGATLKDALDAGISLHSDAWSTWADSTASSSSGHLDGMTLIVNR
jgi:hypothetical protein